MGEHLKEALDDHVKNSETGKILLNPILNGKDYIVLIKNEGNTATNGKRVTINTGQVGIDKAKNVADLKEFIESTIFELTNAKNWEVFAKLQDSLIKGGLPIMDYGKEKSDYEAEASHTVANIIQELEESTKYVPSKWGKAHVEIVQKKSLKEVEKIFAKAPHVNGADDESGLITPLFYAYKGGVIIGGKSKSVDACFKKIMKKIGNKDTQVYVQNLVKLSSNENKQNSGMNPKWCALYYHVIMDLILDTDAFTSKDLGKGSADDWQFTNEMKKLVPDKNDALKKQLLDILNNQKMADKLTEK